MSAALGSPAKKGISMSYHDLDVWQKSIELAEMSYRLSARFPREERFGITSQMRRSAASVAANIAEGANRHSLKEYLQFLGIASGSLAETETYLVLAQRLGIVEEEQIRPVQGRASEAGKMLNGLKRSLRERLHGS